MTCHLHTNTQYRGLSSTKTCWCVHTYSSPPPSPPSPRLPSEFPRLAVLQQRKQQFGAEQLLRFVSSQPLPPAGTVPATHGCHQQPGALPILRHQHAVLSALPGHERQHAIPAGLTALPVLLPDPVAGPAGMEQPTAAGSARQPPRKPQQQDHQH